MDAEELKKLFDRFDRDHSGTIDAGELGRLLESVAAGTSEQLLEALASLETKRRDRITWEEFQRWWAAVDEADAVPAKRASSDEPESAEAETAANPAQSERDLREIFGRFDRDRSGSIDARELGALLEALGRSPDDEEVAALVRRFDRDRSGRITFEELRVWWNEEA